MWWGKQSGGSRIYIHFAVASVAQGQLCRILETPELSPKEDGKVVRELIVISVSWSTVALCVPSVTETSMQCHSVRKSTSKIGRAHV